MQQLMNNRSQTTHTIGHVLSYLIAIWALSAPSFATRSIDILCLLYDAGETFALLPVLERLPPNVNYQIVATGTAKRLTQEHPAIFKFKSGNDNPERHTPLSSTSATQIKAAFDPKIVLTGMVSQWQADVLKQFPKASNRKVGFYDSFHQPIMTSYLTDLCHTLDDVIVPLPSLAQSFTACGVSTEPHVLGHPTIDEWQQRSQQIKQDKMHHPTVLIVGGYGDPFIKSMHALTKALGSQDKYKVQIRPHPKTGADTLKSWLGKTSTSMQILQNISTMDAALRADLVICHRSTVCVQAFFAGKKVLYFDLEPQGYKNWLIEKKYVRQVSVKDALLKELTITHSHIDIKPDHIPPKQATKHIAAWLEHILEHT